MDNSPLIPSGAATGYCIDQFNSLLLYDNAISNDIFRYDIISVDMQEKN